jgi:NAD dependent epimerase/dehydratase family enzyme
MAEELLLSGQCVYPQRLLDFGFKFKYPDVESALQHIYQGVKSAPTT